MMKRFLRSAAILFILLSAASVSFADSPAPDQPSVSKSSVSARKTAPVVKLTVKRTVTNSSAQNKKKDSDGIETNDGKTSVSTGSQSNSNGSGSSVGVIILQIITILGVVGLIVVFQHKIRKISGDFEDNLEVVKNNMTTYVKNGLHESGWDEMQSKIMSSGASSFPSGDFGQGQQQEILNAIYDLRNDLPGQAATPQADFSQIINAINELKKPLSEAERQEELNRQLAADQEQVNAVQQEHAQEIATLKAEHEKKLKEALDRQLAADREEMNAKIAKLNSVYEGKLAEVQDYLKNQEKQLEDAQKTHAQEIATLKAELTAANENLKTQKADYEEQLTATQEQYAAEIANLKAEFYERLTATQDQHANEITELTAEHEKQLTAAQENLKTQKNDYEKQLTETKVNLIKESFPPAACEFRTWLEGQADLKSEKADLVLHSLSRLEILSHGEDKKPCYDDLLRFDTLLWDTFGSDKQDADFDMLHKIRDELEILLNDNVLKDMEYQIKWAKPGIGINEGDNYRIVDDIGHIVKVAVNGLVTKSGKVLQRSKVICE